MHLKHRSSDHNTSRDLEFDKNVPRLVTTGAINLKKKQSEGNTLLCYEYLFYNTQVQMLKSFNSLLIQKFTVSAQETSCQNSFFEPTARAQIFFGTMVLCRNFFSKSTTPPPLYYNGWPLNRDKGKETFCSGILCGQVNVTFSP